MKQKGLIYVICMTIMTFMGCKNNSELTMLVGTYTSGSSEGIYAFRLDTEKLTTTPLGNAKVDNPSYLAISPDAKYVYAASEDGVENSVVSAFAFDKQQRAFTFLNRQKVGADPCYILLDAQRNFVATANYSGGSVSFISVAPEDGKLLGEAHTLKFSGRGADSVRQTKPHMHCLVMTPDRQAILASDLGTDRIHKIEIQHTTDKEKLPAFHYNELSDAKLTPRSGPRHFVFNQAGTHMYLINEISGMVDVFLIGSENNLEQIQAVLADTLKAEGSADIHLSPDEKFLYVSTRLNGDGIVIFKVDFKGVLTRVGYQATGKHPRNFIITPDGKIMLVACKDAGMIQLFHIDKETGLLTDTGKSISIDQPVCIKFAD